jgi:hypothetical protein
MNQLYSILENVIIFNSKIYTDKLELPKNINEIKIPNTSLVLLNMDGNVSHFQNEWLYNFYVCATRSEKIGIKNIDNIILCKENNDHFFSFTINSLSIEVKNKIQIAEKNQIYECKKIILPTNCRELKYRENRKTLWPEIRKNLFDNYQLKNKEKKTKKILIHNDTSHGREILNLRELIEKLKINFEVEFINGHEWFKSNSSQKIVETYYSADFYISPWGASFAECKLTKESCKLIILKAKSLETEDWYLKSKNPSYEDRDWSVEHIYTHDLNQEVFVVNCDWKKWQNPLVGTQGYLSIERTADLIVNIEEIIDIINLSQ